MEKTSIKINFGVIIIIVGFVLIIPIPIFAENCILNQEAISIWSGESNAFDSTGKNNGTLINGVNFMTGKVGNAFYLDGENDYVDLGSLGINSPKDSFSIITWIKPNENTLKEKSEHTIIGQGQGHPGSNHGKFFVELNVIQNNTIVMNIGNTQTWVFQSMAKNVLTLNKWTFIATTYDGSTSPKGLKLYIDGDLNHQNFDNFPIKLDANKRDDWLIGGHGGHEGVRNFYGGLIDEIKIFNRVLTPHEISLEYLKTDVNCFEKNNELKNLKIIDEQKTLNSNKENINDNFFENNLSIIIIILIGISITGIILRYIKIRSIKSFSDNKNS